MSPPYYERVAASYVRGKLHETASVETYGTLFSRPLDLLAQDELVEIISIGNIHGLRLHRFKRTMDLARVRKVLGILRGIQPANVLDIGSGRGAFLWPLLDAIPALPVTATDILGYRVRDVEAVHDGGVTHLTAVHADVTALPFCDDTFDVVTMLEVLEHVPDSRQALAEVCRVARRFVILSVPSKSDSNPEHIHLFDAATLVALLREQGLTRVKVDPVLNHYVVVARGEA
jgi:ubiquinone/menaquinone biosynthesis C-methylase UbiE